MAIPVISKNLTNFINLTELFDPEIKENISLQNLSNLLPYSPILDTNSSEENIVNSTTLPLNSISIPYLVCEIVVALLAVIGNALTVTVFAIERKLRRMTNYYIVSLAVADLLVGILGVPFAILTYVGLPRPLMPCLLMLSMLVVLCTVSIFCLVAVSIDRYWAILHPMIYARVMTSSLVRRKYHEFIFLCKIYIRKYFKKY